MKELKYEYQNSYDVVIFHFMNTHPPIKHIQSVTLSIYINFGWLMRWVVGGDGVVGGFMVWVGGWGVHGMGGCVSVWVVVGCMVGGWLESSWVGEYMHQPHSGVLA